VPSVAYCQPVQTQEKFVASQKRLYYVDKRETDKTDNKTIVPRSFRAKLIF